MWVAGILIAGRWEGCSWSQVIFFLPQVHLFGRRCFRLASVVRGRRCFSFFRRCFCSAAGAFVWLQLFLVAGVFLSSAGAFVRPQMLSFGFSCSWSQGFFFLPQVLLFGRMCFRLASVGPGRRCFSFFRRCIVDFVESLRSVPVSVKRM